MTGPPGARPISKPTFREVEKQARVFDPRRGVRIFGQNGLVDVCKTPNQLERYLSAPNADIVRSRPGEICAVRLWSFGDDQGHSPERHGSSKVTTRRIRNDGGLIIAPDYAIEHKVNLIESKRTKFTEKAHERLRSTKGEDVERDH